MNRIVCLLGCGLCLAACTVESPVEVTPWGSTPAAESVGSEPSAGPAEALRPVVAANTMIGRAVLKGQGIGYTDVSAFRLAGGAPLSSSRTDSSGQFQLGFVSESNRDAVLRVQVTVAGTRLTTLAMRPKQAKGYQLQHEERPLVLDFASTIAWKTLEPRLAALGRLLESNSEVDTSLFADAMREYHSLCDLVREAQGHAQLELDVIGVSGDAPISDALARQVLQHAPGFDQVLVRYAGALAAFSASGAQPPVAREWVAQPMTLFGWVQIPAIDSFGRFVTGRGGGSRRAPQPMTGSIMIDPATESVYASPSAPPNGVAL